MLRSLLAALLVLALIPVAVAANTSVWASRTVLDRTTFTTAVSRALDDPSLERDVVRRLTRELYAALVAGDERRRIVLAGALGLGGEPSDGEVLSILETRVGRALDDPAALAARDRLVDDAHAALTGAERPDGTVRIAGDRFVVDVRPLLQAIVETLGPGGSPVGLAVPAGVSTEIRLDEAPGIGAARDGLSALQRLAIILPLTALLLALLVLIVAHRRARAVGSIGVAAVIAGLAGIAVVLLGGILVARSGANLDPTLTDATVGLFSGVLLVQSAALVGAGLVLAFIGTVGSARGARRVRPVAYEEEW